MQIQLAFSIRPFIDRLRTKCQKPVLTKKGTSLPYKLAQSYIAGKFETLFGEIYIGKHPTKLKNTYHILRFNFSEISTETIETTMQGFREKLILSGVFF